MAITTAEKLMAQGKAERIAEGIPGSLGVVICVQFLSPKTGESSDVLR